MNKSVNPEIHETQKLSELAVEIRDWLDLDWSYLYGNDVESIMQFRDVVATTFASSDWKQVREQCPLLIEYFMEDCNNNPLRADWNSLAIAVDNLNGMYHPLRLTRIVMDKDTNE